MQVIDLHDFHNDKRRELKSWHVEMQTSEIKYMRVGQNNVVLGGHKHPFEEKFIIVQGSVNVVTWSKASGRQEYLLEAPQVAVFDSDEEHVIHCDADTIIIVFLKDAFLKDNIIPAENI